MTSDAELLQEFEAHLSAKHKKSTAKTYRTGPRAFARWLGHEDDCSNPHPSGYRTKLQHCMSEEGDAEQCTELLLDGVSKQNLKWFVRDLKLDDYGHTTIRSYYFGMKEFVKFVMGNFLDIEDGHPLDFKSYEEDPLSEYNISQNKTKKQAVDVSEYWGDNRLKNMDVVAFPAKNVREIINAAPAVGSKNRNKLLLKLLWQTGARAAELTTLEWDDVDRSDHVVGLKTAKTRSERDEYRYISYREQLDTLFRLWKEEQPALTYPDTEYVFSTEQSEQMSPNRINQIVRAAADAAGYSKSYETKGGKRHEFSAHLFRSSFATFCANSQPKIEITDLKYMLGHSSLSETQKYVMPNVEAHIEASRHGPR